MRRVYQVILLAALFGCSNDPQEDMRVDVSKGNLPEASSSTLTSSESTGVVGPKFTIPDDGMTFSLTLPEQMIEGAAAVDIPLAVPAPSRRVRIDCKEAAATSETAPAFALIKFELHLRNGDAIERSEEVVAYNCGNGAWLTIVDIPWKAGVSILAEVYDRRSNLRYEGRMSEVVALLGQMSQGILRLKPAQTANIGVDVIFEDADQ